MSWVKDFREFASETSAHGVKNIFEGPSKIVKVLFLLTWIAMTIYSCNVIVTSIVRFVNKPTGTKFEVIVDNAESGGGGKPQAIKFPTISVCTHNKVKRTYLDKEENKIIKEAWEKIDMYDKDETAKLRKKMDDAGNDLYKVGDMTYEEIIEKGGPGEHLLLMCAQRAEQCQNLAAFPNEKYFEMENSITGRCFRINPNGTLYGKMGDYGSLILYFWADIQNYALNTKQSPAQGFTVAFHDNSTYGSTMSAGFLMSPGTFYKVDLRHKKEIRSPPPSGKCNDTIGKTTYGEYSEGACILECKDEALYNKCGCVNVVPPINFVDGKVDENGDPIGRYRSCTLREWIDCGQDEYQDWYTNFTDPARTDPFCPCSTPCLEIRYEAQVSSSSVSTPFSEWVFSRVQNAINAPPFSDPGLGIVYNTSQEILNNLMVLEVLFTSMQTSEIREVITYTSANLLGDIGGVLGLFLGASLFTVLEFIQFLFFSIGRHCCNIGGTKPERLDNGDDDDKEQQRMVEKERLAMS